MKTNSKFPQALLLALFLSFAYAESSQAQGSMPKDFTELPDPTADTLSNWSGVKKGLHSSFVSIDKRFPKSVAPNIQPLGQHVVSGWKGERVSSQILLWSTEAIPDVQATVSSFTSSSNDKLPANIATANFLRYVMTDEFAEGCGARKPENFAASLSADMIDHLKSYNLEGKKVRPVWVSISIPKDAKPGKYKATVKVTAKGQKPKNLNLTLEVINKSLPDASQWTYHLDQWQHPAAIARVEGLPVWSDQHFKAMKPTMEMLAKAGQKVITTTLNKDPWNIQTYDPYADMISWTKQKDGSWSYDYAVFDKWVNFMMDLGVTKMINCYSIVPWNNEIHYKDAASDKLVNVVAKPGTAVFEELWTPFLKDFTKHLKQKGWLKITNIAMDERERHQMDAAINLIYKVAPELGISYADNQKTYQRYPDSKDISISAQHPFDHKDLVDRKAKGLTTTFYICCSDAFPNQFTFSDPAESTYLAWYALAADFDGMLRWSYNSWVENPLQDSRFRTWPAGDTYIVYPNGRSSVRFERTMEGVQDYEKAQIILKDLAKRGEHEKLKEFKLAIAKLKSTIRTNHWNVDLNEAKNLLNDLSRTIY